MLWYSADGIKWNRVDHSEASPDYPKVEGEDWWISIDWPGARTSVGLVQPGLRCVTDYVDEKCAQRRLGFMWLSETGEEWTAPTLPEGVKEWWPTMVIEGENGIVVVGDRSPDCTFCRLGFEPDPLSAVAFHTVDGVHWTEAALPFGEGRAGTAVATPMGFIATVQQEWPPELIDMWHSDNGVTWDLLPAIDNQPQGLWVDSLTWDGDELLLFGSAAGDGGQAVLLGRWTAP